MVNDKVSTILVSKEKFTAICNRAERLEKENLQLKKQLTAAIRRADDYKAELEAMCDRVKRATDGIAAPYLPTAHAEAWHTCPNCGEPTLAGCATCGKPDCVAFWRKEWAKTLKKGAGK